MSGDGPNVGASTAPVDAPHSEKRLAEIMSIRELVKNRAACRPCMSRECFTHWSASDFCTASAGQTQNGSVALEVHLQFNSPHLVTPTPIRERSSDPAVKRSKFLADSHSSSLEVGRFILVSFWDFRQFGRNGPNAHFLHFSGNSKF
jgi:hypothetical protein